MRNQFLQLICKNLSIFVLTLFGQDCWRKTIWEAGLILFVESYLILFVVPDAFYQPTILYIKRTWRSQRAVTCNILLLPAPGIFICIALFTPRWTLISRRIGKETRIGIVKQDVFVHFRGFMTSKSATLFYVWLVSSKMKNGTWNQQ